MVPKNNLHYSELLYNNYSATLLLKSTRSFHIKHLIVLKVYTYTFILIPKLFLKKLSSEHSTFLCSFLIMTTYRTKFVVTYFGYITLTNTMAYFQTQYLAKNKYYSTVLYLYYKQQFISLLLFTFINGIIL